MAEQLRGVCHHVVQADKENERRFSRCVTKMECNAALQARPERHEVDKILDDTSTTLEEKLASKLTSSQEELRELLRRDIAMSEQRVITQMEQLNQQRVEIEQQIRQEAANHIARTTVLEKQASEILQQQTTFQQQMQTVQDDTVAIRQSINNIQQDIDRINNSIQRHSEAFSDVRSRVKDVFDSMQSKFADTRSRYDSLESLQRVMKGTLQSLDDRVKELKAMIEQCSATQNETLKQLATVKEQQEEAVCLCVDSFTHSLLERCTGIGEGKNGSRSS